MEVSRYYRCINCGVEFKLSYSTNFGEITKIYMNKKGQEPSCEHGHTLESIGEPIIKNNINSEK